MGTMSECSVTVPISQMRKQRLIPHLSALLGFPTLHLFWTLGGTLGLLAGWIKGLTLHSILVLQKEFIKWFLLLPHYMHITPKRSHFPNQMLWPVISRIGVEST